MRVITSGYYLEPREQKCSKAKYRVIWCKQ